MVVVASAASWGDSGWIDKREDWEDGRGTEVIGDECLPLSNLLRFCRPNRALQR